MSEESAAVRVAGEDFGHDDLRLGEVTVLSDAHGSRTLDAEIGQAEHPLRES